MKRPILFRLIPLFECSPWGGDMDAGDGRVDGRSFSVAWLGLYVEVIFARETVR